MRKQGVSHALSLLDVANAFPSPHRGAMRSTVDRVACSIDNKLLQQRHESTFMHITARDGDVCVQPNSGSLQGDSVACALFLEVYHPQLDKWLQETKQHELLVQDPISHELLDISVSSSADDVARCTVAESSEELFLHITHSNDVLDTALGEIGLKQNTDKQEHIVYFSGAGANSYLAHIYKEGMLPGKSCVSAKYLGGWRHFKGSNDMEIRARRRAAEIGFMAMGKFWARQSATSAAKIVFSAMVRNAALSGLENLVLSDAEYQQVDATIFRFARKVLRGAACKKVVREDGSTQYHAIPDSDVGKLLSFVPAKLELCVRRLQCWQSVARDPFLHRQALATVFGQLWYDESATVLPDGSLHMDANVGKTIGD